MFIFLCTISNYSIDYVLGKQITRQSPYYLSFASIGAIYLESRMDAWAKIKTSSSTKELEKYLADILKGFTIVYEPEHLEIVETSNNIVLNYEINKKEQDLIINLKSDYQNNESYFYVTIISRNKAISLENYESRLNQIIGLNWQYYYLYQSEIPYLIDQKSQEDLADVVVKNLQAQKVTCYKENGLTNISAYSSKIINKVPSLYINGKRYNMQVTITSNLKDHKTKVYIGLPLILGNY